MFGLNLTSLIPISLVLLSQAQSCEFGRPSNPFGSGEKADRSYEQLKRGDLTNAVNSMTDAPCATCKETKTGWSFFGSRKSFKDTHMVASVANTDCLTKEGRSFKAAPPSFKSTGANRGESKRVEALIKGISQASGSMANRLLGNVDVRFYEDLGNRSDSKNCIPAHQLNGYISVSRSCAGQFGDDMVDALVVHEVGHYAANRAGLYAKYNDAVPKRKQCKLSGYCTKSQSGRKHSNRNEEFAEVFSAYLVATERLKSMCPESYKFMKEEVFKGSSNYNCREK